MPHKRIDIAQDDNALRCLSGCQYKVLQALVNRADERGICFPGDEYLAQATGYTRRSVQRSLAALAQALVIQYHRKDEWDNFTRRQLPNVMQINPDYISLAQEHELDARELWRALTEKCGNDSVRLWSRTITNTKQPIPEPAPGSSASKPTPKTTTPGKAKGRAADYANQRAGAAPGGDEKAKDKNGSSETGQRAARNNQREAPASKSSVPPAAAKYVNPTPINQNIPDVHHEQLAADLRNLGISMPLARGFVMEYGYDRAKAALDETLLMGDRAEKPAAVFRTILQSRLADDFAVSRQKFFSQRKQ